VLLYLEITMSSSQSKEEETINGHPTSEHIDAEAGIHEEQSIIRDNNETGEQINENEDKHCGPEECNNGTSHFGPAEHINGDIQYESGQHGECSVSGSKEPINVLWFRHGLRLHDNWSLKNAIGDGSKAVLPIYIWDGESTVTKLCEYNKIAFLLECLEDLDQSFKKSEGKLYCIKGDPVDVFENLHKNLNVSSICFDQDCEPIWHKRDEKVKTWCKQNHIEAKESVGATLWDPLVIIETNGGSPPVTYGQFCHVTKAVGEPQRPLPHQDLSRVKFAKLNETPLASNIEVYPNIPTAEMLGFKTPPGANKIFKGGETRALEYFNLRLKRERASFENGGFLPNRRDPDILYPTKSLSPDLKFGCISVRRFYWSLMDQFADIHKGTIKPSYKIVSQLIWREFFYAMSAQNPFYAEMDRNPICINVPWSKNTEALGRFKAGKTGFPFIDAGMKQTVAEGWCHHVVRNALSMFLTRGDLWISWEEGFRFFMKYLIDADWAVCAGNWMWVSSSAFEKALTSSFNLDPATYGRRVDPYGTYIKKHLPILNKFPVEYIFEPWLAPIDVQEEAGCIIGKDYPAPMVDHKQAVKRNVERMVDLARRLMENCNMQEPTHIKPSNPQETREFLGLENRKS